MSTDSDYLRFRDDLLVEVANAQTGDAPSIVGLQSLAEAVGLTFQPTWIHMIPGDWLQCGYATDTSSYSERSVLIKGAGLRRAEEIRAARRPLSIIDRLASDRFQRVGNLGISTVSMIVAIAALIVAILAYLKA